MARRDSRKSTFISLSLWAQVSHYLGSRGSRHRCGGAKGFPGQHRPASVSGGGSVSAERRAACVGDSRVSERHADRGPPAPYAFRLPRSPHELAHALALAARDPQAVAPEVDGKPEPERERGDRSKTCVHQITNGRLVRPSIRLMPMGAWPHRQGESSPPEPKASNARLRLGDLGRRGSRSDSPHRGHA